MGKRRNDTGQLSKEEYDSLSNREEEESGGGESRIASREVISKRRIIKVDK
jgi:hypothetical protein